MEQIILLSTILEFWWLVIDGFMEGNDLALPLLKIELGSPNIEDLQEIWNFPSP